MKCFLKNFFLDLKDLDKCSNEELLKFISLHVPQFVTSAWYDCLKKLHLANPNGRIDAIYETALKIRARSG